MLRNITVGIDIGTYQVKVVVSEVIKENGKHTIQIIGMGLTESKGLRHGYIINTKDVTESVRIAVGIAEKMSGVKIHRAYVAIGGIGLSGVTGNASAIVSRADLEITELDMDKVTELCEKELPLPLIQNRRIIQNIPLSYKIDGKLVFAKTPLGMKGSKLEVKMLFITSLEPHVNDLMIAVEEAGIEVIDVIPSPVAASFVTLTKQQKMVGCVLANIGAETISIVVFENNIPISLEVFPIGGTDITNDIALGLKIPLEEAEHIKVGGSSGSFSKKKLDEIISARLSDMFELIENHLKKIGRNGLLPAGIFITGGGSGIALVEDLAKTSLRLPSRLAHLNILEQKNRTSPVRDREGLQRAPSSNGMKDSTWATAYGLCMLGSSKEEKENLGLRPAVNKYGLKLISWFKQFLP